MTSTITYGSEVGSGVSVEILGFVGGEEVVAVAIHRIGLRVAQVDTVVATTRRVSKKHFFIVDNLKPLTAGVNCNDICYTLCRLESSKIWLKLAISDGLNM